MIVAYFNLLIGLLFYTNNELFELETNKNIFESFPSDSKYVSDPFDGEIDLDSFMQMVDDLDLNNHVGYECSYIEFEKDFREFYVYINEYMMKFKYPLEYGEWIQNDEEVIIGGNLSTEYRLGDPYYLGSEFIGTVVGVLGEEYSFMFLNVSGEKLNYKDVFSKSSENIVVTNNKKLRDLLDMPVPTIAIMADDHGCKKLEEEGCHVKNQEVFGQMQKDEYEIRETKVSRLMILLLVGSILLSSFYLLYTPVYNFWTFLKPDKI